ncbi:hypothetical protein SNEBB_004330 [Seison nebaliae]|nr:hypothetical protein SNEBB_004330 [Seison nebaliae]
MNQEDIDDPQIRQRNLGVPPDNSNEPETHETVQSNSNEENVTENDENTPPSAVKQMLIRFFNMLPNRWRNWWIRGISSLFMLLGVYFWYELFGSMGIVLLIYIVQMKCFHEIISIGHKVYQSHELPWFRTVSWYFLAASNYYFYGENVISHFGQLLNRNEFMQPLVTYHRFIAFMVYLAGFVFFVLTLHRKHYLTQFLMFGWTHVTLLIVVTQAHIVVQNIFEGLIWFAFPVLCIITNDIMAYVFGFIFGRTPLIDLSPKKTWEGFIGGAISTIIFAAYCSQFFVSTKSLICPVEFDEDRGALNFESCTPSNVFLPHEYHLPKLFVPLKKTVVLYPFQLHSMAFALFASIIGPFGGFFASGFKRAFRIKDFANTIPGHGGFTDRVDCQFLMGIFVNVYISTFIKSPTPQILMQQLLRMSTDDQLEFLRLLKNNLQV